MANQISEAFSRVKKDMNSLDEKLNKLAVNQEVIVKELMRMKEAFSLSQISKKAQKISKRK